MHVLYCDINMLFCQSLDIKNILYEYANEEIIMSSNSK